MLSKMLRESKRNSHVFDSITNPYKNTGNKMFFYERKVVTIGCFVAVHLLMTWQIVWDCSTRCLNPCQSLYSDVCYFAII